MVFSGPNEEYLEVSSPSDSGRCSLSEHSSDMITFLWAESDANHVTIDGIPIFIGRNEILCITSAHQVAEGTLSVFRKIRFDRSFYCIVDHDKEVGCRGLLFFGAAQIPIIKLSLTEYHSLEEIWANLQMEMRNSDYLQMEMLQTILKRFIISCTRIYRRQGKLDELTSSAYDVVREYNYLVELHYKELHTVADYAHLMHKSPKTLSNLFSKLAEKSPLQIIQHRRLLAARRLLSHSDLSIQEVGYELGFQESQSFSRFFKKYDGKSPSQYRLQFA